MSLLKDNHHVQVGEHDVGVEATSGVVHARWVMSIDGVEVDAAAAAGDFTLRGWLPDGSQVSAQVHQSLLGPTEVTVVHGDEAVGTMKGFVA